METGIECYVCVGQGFTLSSNSTAPGGTKKRICSKCHGEKRLFTGDFKKCIHCGKPTTMPDVCGSCFQKHAFDNDFEDRMREAEALLAQQKEQLREFMLQELIEIERGLRNKLP